MQEKNSIIGPGIKLDALVEEHVFGHPILGETFVYPDPECFGYIIPYDHYLREDSDKSYNVAKRPVYLDSCVCAHKGRGDVDYFDHIAGCLEAVPNYSTSPEDALKILFACHYYNIELESFPADQSDWQIAATIAVNKDSPMYTATTPDLQHAVSFAAYSSVTQSLQAHD